ncbi:hypothetical protein CCACVL1_08270 [Corchorus capsularis]|uniref:Uncharacterized protein n=1 Tax=Corchorus capsularis TaxID=210143 RepID=A0A1R3J1F1_COCAP|nr:hypothetical protein CCACVL1_08270 [Corchorus capsularis]
MTATRGNARAATLVKKMSYSPILPLPC